jgi:hypothetical protein
VDRVVRKSAVPVSRRAALIQSSSEDDGSDSENDERSSASESDSDSEAGDGRRREVESSSDDSDDTERGSPRSASEDEADEDDEDDEDDEESASEDEVAASDQPDEPDEDYRSEARIEVRVHVHEAKELTPMDGSTSDPYAYVTCFGHSEQTKTASKGTDAIWDEELQFSGSMEELEGGVVSIAVWDEDLGADDLIGTFDFDLDHVRARPDKEVRGQWLPPAPREQLPVLFSPVEFV